MAVLTYTGKTLAQVALGVAEGDVYTVPAATVARVEMIHLCNTDTSDRTIRLWNIPPAGVSAIANALFYDYTVPANGSLPVPVALFLAATGKIRGLASVAAVVSCQIFGIEELTT